MIGLTKKGRSLDRPLFVRLSDKERKVIEYACKIERGKVRGEMSAFTRRILLLYSRDVIEQHRKKAEG